MGKSLTDLKISMPETLEKVNGYLNESKLVLDFDKIELTVLQSNQKLVRRSSLFTND